MPIAIPGVYGGNTANDVVRYGQGFVAVGSVNGGCCDGSFSEQTRGLVWRSRDGVSWHLVPDEKDFRYGRMVAVAVRGDRLVAVGSRNLDGIDHPVGAAWTSDDGSNWRLVRDVPTFLDVVATQAAFVAAAGSDLGDSIWSSPDGEAWHRLGTADLGNDRVRRIVQLDGDYLLVGWNPQLGHEDSHTTGVIWRSTTGTDWVRVPDQAALDGISVHDAARLGDAFIAFGTTDSEEHGVLLVSSDGTVWTRVAREPFAGPGPTIDRLVSANGAVIATGWMPGGSDAGFHAWTSTDGLDWELVGAQDGTSGAGIEIEGWVPTDEGILAVGRASLGDELGAPAAWWIR